MPPRLGPRTAQVPGSQQCLRPKSGSNLRQSPHRRDFSASSGQQFHASCKNDTRLRRNMFAWLNGPGRVFREPLPKSTNYLGAYDRAGQLLRLRDVGRDNEEKAEEEAEDEDDASLSDEEKQQRREEEGAIEKQNRLPPARGNDFRVYPLNADFMSQSVLSEDLRDEIYKKVVNEKLDLAAVSATHGVDMRRVAAVVRLKTIENDWVAQGKRLATPYASAVMAMLPQTRLRHGGSGTGKGAHESINDLPVHPYTRQQIFYPTSESRQFTRADAAKVFSPTLLPADDRIPLSELVQIERDALSEVSRDKRVEAARERTEKKLQDKEEKERKQQEWEAQNIKKVAGQRWEFKFQNINVEDAGKDGRGRKGVGWRYGNPHHDRKRGAVKIPTSVA